MSTNTVNLTNDSSSNSTQSLATDSPTQKSASSRVDLNADVAEGYETDAKLLKIVSSANVSAGLHAGSVKHMLNTLQVAKANNVRVGAHPGLDDRENFGRIAQDLSESEYRALISYQLGAVKAVCDLVGVKLSYVKPHGALYNEAAKDKALAHIVISEIKRFDSSLAVMGLSGSYLINAAKELGMTSISEVFADRNYENDGTLVSRSKGNALITDVTEATEHVLKMITKGVVTSVQGVDVPVEAQSICLHGDNEHALQFAQEIKTQLQARGVDITAN